MILDNEIWKDIKGYEGLYQVSNLGRVKSVARTIDTTFKGKPIKRQVYEKILKTAIYCYGYKYVCLSKDCKIKKCKVHRLVAETFLENTNNYPVINHKDGNKLNNNVNNI